MSKQFKVGPAKTRSGLDAFINEEFEGRLYGRHLRLNGIWTEGSWTDLGHVEPANLYYSDWDLMPNVEPEKFTFECTWNQSVLCIHPQFDSLAPLKTLTSLVGKRTRVDVTVLNDESES